MHAGSHHSGRGQRGAGKYQAVAAIGSENFILGSDYPHPPSTYPTTPSMYFTDRGLEELSERRGEERVDGTLRVAKLTGPDGYQQLIKVKNLSAGGLARTRARALAGPGGRGRGAWVAPPPVANGGRSLVNA